MMTMKCESDTTYTFGRTEYEFTEHSCKTVIKSNGQCIEPDRK